MMSPEDLLRRAVELSVEKMQEGHGGPFGAVIARGGDFFEPVEPPPDGDIAFAEAKALAAGRMTLGGNVEARVIEYGSVGEVEEATRRAFEGGKARMVLKLTEGPLRKLGSSALANYHRLIDVWEELSDLSGRGCNRG